MNEIQIKACCEKYSPLLDKWEDTPVMQQRRAGNLKNIKSNTAPRSVIDLIRPITIRQLLNAFLLYFQFS